MVWAIWLIKTSDRPIAGEIFLVPACLWFCSGAPAIVCGMIGFAQVLRHRDHLRGKWLSLTGAAIGAVGPALAIVDNIMESSHDSR